MRKALENEARSAKATDSSDIGQFFVMVGFYHAFCLGYAEGVHPVTEIHLFVEIDV